MIVCHRLPRTTKLSPFRESIVAKILPISLALQVSCDPFKAERDVLVKMYALATGFCTTQERIGSLSAVEECMVHARLKALAEQAATLLRMQTGPAVTQMDQPGEYLEASLSTVFAWQGQITCQFCISLFNV